MSGRLRLASSATVDATAPPRTGPIEVVVVDDRFLTRRCLRRLLESEPNMEVIGEAEALAGAVAHLDEHRPHVLVLNLGVSGVRSLQTVHQLRERAPGTQIVVVTMEENPALARRALAAGALGFVLTDRAHTGLLPAVRAAARGTEYLSPGVAARLAALADTI